MISSRIFISILVYFVVISAVHLSQSFVQGCDQSTNFLCNRTNVCLPGYVHCDGSSDCPEGEDEVDCDRCGTGNREGYFTCSSAPSLCLVNSKKCDGHRDCPLNEDEKDCGDIDCKPNEFTCNDRKQCIPESWQCDEQIDCEDQSDEQDCNSDQSNTCRGNEWQCTGSSQCIFSGWKCDNDTDCTNGADEDRTMCQNIQITCLDGWFRCQKASGFECAPNRWLCDGTPDCYGGHDEENCSSKQVPVYRPTSCGQLEYPCANGECILLDWKCDGEFDCSDNSDEGINVCNVETVELNCANGQYKCANEQKCIPDELLCDGVAHCNGSDDEDMLICYPPSPNGNTTRACTDNEFKCQTSHICIPLSQTCNRIRNCEDGSDEEYCGTNPCDLPQNCNGTSQSCVPLVNQNPDPGVYGFKCECKTGYSYHIDTKTCIDIDECMLRPCDQGCLNTPGSYECRCEDGYVLGVNGTCKVSGSMHPKLLFSNRHDIRQVKVNDKDPEYTPLVFSKTAVAIDFDVQQRLVFYSDVTEKKIVQFSMPQEMDEEDPELVDLKFPHINAPNGVAGGLAYDWIYKHLYWTDTDSNTINIGCMEENQRYSRVIIENADPQCRSTQTLVSHSPDVCIDEPRAVAVHPRKGWIFWTDWGVNPHIARAALDGSGVVKLVYNTNRKTLVHWPNGVTIDQSRGAERLYWIDAKLNSIYSCPLEDCQENAALVAYDSTKIKHPYSITVFEDKLYWSDWVSRGIVTAHKRSGEILDTIVEGLDQPMDLKVFHNVTQPASDNVCHNLNSKERCEHICVPKQWVKLTGYDRYQPPRSKQKHTCLCAHGYDLNADGRTCKERPKPSTEPVAHPATSQHTNIGIVAAAASGAVVLLGLIIGVALFCVVKRRRAERAKAVARFENPVYKNTTSHRAEDRMELPPNEYQPDRSVPSAMVPLTSPEATSMSNQDLNV